MDFLGAFNNRDILIPVLQRDYVQGATESVIVPFLDHLLDSDCDLNYIYGYDEDYCFVPVDGQQRLITLWLLHLYVHSRKTNPDKEFNVELKFQSKEYATEFCSRLKEKLRDLLIKTDDIQELDKEIKDRNWFISSWDNNATVANMLNTLRYIHKIINKDNIDIVYDRLFVGLSPISFAFLDMTEENGLDDDIYIKMNGRGRPLSAFENLKSWMDQQIDSLDIAAEWRGYMDNRWTNLFWKNRNLSQEHSEEIDDEQLHLFCNLLVVFHVKNDHFLKDSLPGTKYKEELIDYLEIDGEDITENIIINKILANLVKGEMMPLVWLERLQMMPSEFFYFAFKSLNTLSSRYNDVNKSGLYFGGEELDHDKRQQITRLYELSMTKASFGRTLPLLYAIICFHDESRTNIYDWLRVTRNLMLNRESKEGEINADLKNVLSSLDAFADKVRTEEIFDFLAGSSDTIDQETHVAEVSETLFPFSNQQIREEIFKANAEMRPFHKKFAELENLRFFSGRIKALFSMLPENEFNSDCIEATVNLLIHIFNGGDNGVTGRFDDNNHYLRRALMTYPPYRFGFERKKYWTFCNGLDEWRRYVRSRNPEALISFVRDFASKRLNEDQLYESLREKTDNYPTEITSSNQDSFRFCFIRYPEVWDYMRTKLAIWGENPFDIELKKSNSNNSLRFELRTYCLYLDYINNAELKRHYEDCGWNIGRYEKDDTCFYLEHTVNANDGESNTIAIDVLFRGVDGKRDSENCYALNVFVRTDDDDDSIAICRDILLPVYKEIFNKLNIIPDERCGRFVNQYNLSREEIIRQLKALTDISLFP